MKLVIKAYLSKEQFFKLPSAEQRKRAATSEVYKKYLKEGKGGLSKLNFVKRHKDKKAVKNIDKTIDDIYTKLDDYSEFHTEIDNNIDKSKKFGGLSKEEFIDYRDNLYDSRESYLDSLANVAERYLGIDTDEDDNWTETALKSLDKMSPKLKNKFETCIKEIHTLENEINKTNKIMKRDNPKYFKK